MSRSLSITLCSALYCAALGAAAGTALASDAQANLIPGMPVAATAWSAPVPVNTLNTAAAEGCPIETADGLSLLFASTRSGEAWPGALGMNDIWVADRARVGDAWSTPRNLGTPINSPAQDFCPTPIRGRSLLFVSSRGAGEAGSCGSGDMFISRQSPAGGWADPVRLGCQPAGPNTTGGERSPSLVETWYGTFLFYSAGGDPGQVSHLYVSEMQPDGSFGKGEPVEDLNSGGNDGFPNVRLRSDGLLEIVFISSREGSDDIYYSIAKFANGPWRKPARLSNVSDPGAAEARPTLSADGQRLYFGRNGDLWIAERSSGH